MSFQSIRKVGSADSTWLLQCSYHLVCAVLIPPSYSLHKFLSNKKQGGRSLSQFKDEICLKWSKFMKNCTSVGLLSTHYGPRPQREWLSLSLFFCTNVVPSSDFFQLSMQAVVATCYLNLISLCCSVIYLEHTAPFIVILGMYGFQQITTVISLRFECECHPISIQSHIKLRPMVSKSI